LRNSISTAAYGKNSEDDTYVKAALGENGLGLNRVRTYNYDTNYSRDGIGFSIASKTVQLNDKENDFIVVTIRGTDAEEWYGDFNIGTGANHASFNIAKNEIFSALKSYIAEYGLGRAVSFDGGLNMRPFKFLITGHSRGAAVANLLATEIIKQKTALEDFIKAELKANTQLVEWFGASALDSAVNSANMFDRKNIFAYTFATPNVTTDSTAKTVSGYGNIFNIVNAEDFVPYMPLPVAGWGYWKYGKTLAFPSGGMDGDDPSYRTPQIRNMLSDFKNLTGQDFVRYDNGYQSVHGFVENMRDLAPSVNAYYNTKYTAFAYSPADYFKIICDELVSPSLVNKAVLASFLAIPAFHSVDRFLIKNSALKPTVVHAHCPEAYLSWMKATSASDLIGAEDAPSGIYARIACPVDIEVFNQSGALVGKTVNDIPSADLSDDVSVSVVGDVKNVFLPSSDKYTIRFVGTGNGTMNYRIELFNIVTVQTVSQKSFANVALYDGKTMESTVSGAVAVPDIKLFVIDEAGEKKAEILPNGSEIAIGSPQPPTTAAPIINGDKNVKVEYVGSKQLSVAGEGITWSGSNKYVTVDQSGRITSNKGFIKTGTAIIRAENSAGYVEFNVKVAPSPLQWFYIICLFGWIWM
jgi:hypothetical protein